ncbi:Cytochrome bd ubiquinol oxidase subunit X [Andreprevotia sp. IGB-42]|uniref:cytochrome bd-I oxidase subunit CydX n=1 Tax=Andreprevotia sp. IGB-42 TaxID=2497473 RepID=UPI00135A7117|nr:Cytochrome bd ubiquinol oxidase subunit X [Andreprevotia sp. IGB-42]
MWYFAWILGLGLALAFGVVNVMWLESQYAFGGRTADATQKRFEDYRKKRRKSAGAKKAG